MRGITLPKCGITVLEAREIIMKTIKGAKLNEHGRFETLRDEPLSKQQIGLRLPISQFNLVKEKGVEWIRNAIAEKLQRESVIVISAEEKATERIDRLDDQSNYTMLGEVGEKIDIKAINKHLSKRGKKQVSITG
jgi:hypothetical protein